MLQGDVPDGGDVEEAGEQVWQLRGEDVEQGHAAVQPGQGRLTPQQLSAGKAGGALSAGARAGPQASPPAPGSARQASHLGLK